MALLTLIQQQLIKPIDESWAVGIPSGVAGGLTSYETAEIETEESGLADLLGIALLQDLQDFPAKAENVILLDGGTYVNCDGNTIRFKGVRYTLAYMVWAIHIDLSFIEDTFSGMTKKDTQESEHLNVGERKNLSLYYNSLGAREFEKTKDFLNENSSTYPLWNCTNTKKIALPKFTGIRKTVRR